MGDFSSIFQQENASINNSVSNSSTESQERIVSCNSLIGEDNISFIDRQNDADQFRHQHPSYLFSYGGSGNTVTRTIFEYITNIWTTSIYHDRELNRIGFKGESKSCKIDDTEDRPVLLIKAHPEAADKLWRLPSNILRRCLGHPKPYYKRFKGASPPVDYGFISAVFIMRDPWKSIFTMFQYTYGVEGESQHIRRMMLNKWNQSETKQLWTDFVGKEITMWSRTVDAMRLMDRFNDDDGVNRTDYVVMKYENIISKDIQMAMDEIRKVLRFLYSDNYYAKMEDTFTERMQCIFGQFGLMWNDIGRFGTMHRKPANASIHLTFDVAYQYLIEEHLEVLCKAWQQIEEIAAMYSYEMLYDLDCQYPHASLNVSQIDAG